MQTRWLRTVVFSGFALLALAARVPESGDARCFSCHGSRAMTKQAEGGKVISLFVDKAKFAKSVHGSMGCTGCHDDLEGASHPGKTPPKAVTCGTCHAKPTQTYDESSHGAARRSGKLGAAQCADCHGKHDIVPSLSPESPVSRLHLSTTCGKCHVQIVKDVEESTHGQAVAKGIKEAPTCTDCHSDHKIEDLRSASTLRLAEQICSRCHSSERLNSKFSLPTNRVSSFFDSYHGLAARMGSASAANCASCHGFHNILPPTDPKSMVHKDNLVRTCQKCHPGANEKFSLGKIHLDEKDMESRGERINNWIRRIYIGMIVGTIGGMILHNLFALWKKARKAFRDPERTVVRMNLLARIQHILLASSFIYLVISGFALKYSDSWLTFFVGSSEVVRRTGHRIAAVVMILLSVAHVVYLLATRDGRKFLKDMFPETKDLWDLIDNLKYLFLGLPTRPKFKRFGYAEKAEYWAVVWGTAVMGGTGLLLWFKIYFSQWLPRWVVDVATTIHLYEAILATLAIIVWHFYFVIFDPDIYPINWAWLDGRVTPEHHHEEHPLDVPEDDSH
jgi:cytochrome b subunit of formate dehydrogenase